MPSPTRLPAMVLLGIALCCSSGGPLSAGGPGRLVVHEDPRIALLVQKHIHMNSRQPGVMEGYRIQLFFDSGSDSKKRALDFMAGFQMKYPDIPVYLTFQEPFFKVRAGNFRYRVEADGLLGTIKTDFPDAFTVKDKIAYPFL